MLIDTLVAACCTFEELLPICAVRRHVGDASNTQFTNTLTRTPARSALGHILQSIVERRKKTKYLKICQGSIRASQMSEHSAILSVASKP